MNLIAPVLQTARGTSVRSLLLAPSYQAIRCYASEPGKEGPTHPLPSTGDTWPASAKHPNPQADKETILKNLPNQCKTCGRSAEKDLSVDLSVKVQEKVPDDAPPVYTNPSGTAGPNWMLWMGGAAVGLGAYYYYYGGSAAPKKTSEPGGPPAALPPTKADPAIDRAEKMK